MAVSIENILQKEKDWIKDLRKLSRGRALLEHLAAFDVIICSGGLKGIEPPIRQTETWKRIFCYEYAKTNKPLGIVDESGGDKLAKCVAICNLSGKHAIFYSSHCAMAKVLCLSAQDMSADIAAGVCEVIEKADALGASILVCFCLPFQAGIERAYWEIRTVRKTSKGVVKDGELCFASGDNKPRTVPETCCLEFWSDQTLSSLAKELTKHGAAVCLDRAECDDDKPKMNAENLESMVEMLSANRKKILSEHNTQIVEMERHHRVQLAEMAMKAENAELEADLRISRIIDENKNVAKKTNSKVILLEQHLEELKTQVQCATKLADERAANLNGEKLAREQERNEALIQKNDLDSQNSSLKKLMAKQMSEQTKLRKGELRNYESQLATLRTTIAELKASETATKAASRAVQASAKEARAQLCTFEKVHTTLEQKCDTACRKLRVCAALLAVAGLRFQSMKACNVQQAKELKDNRVKCSQAELQARDALKQEREVHKTRLVEMDVLKGEIRKIDERPLESAQQLHETAENAKLTSKLNEAMKEVARKQHLVTETEKRCRSLDKRYCEAEAEVQKLKSVQIPTAVVEEAKERHHDDVRIDQRSNNQNFHQNPYAADAALENSVSQLYSTLAFLTSTARSSVSNSTRADLLQARLDTLASVGIQPLQNQYFHAQQYAPNFFNFPNPHQR